MTASAPLRLVRPTAPGETPAPPAARTRRAVVAGLVRTARPRQWSKNGLVLAAPFAAGIITEPGSAARVAVAFVAFCLAASGTYLLNDAVDVKADQRHPTKRLRPVAAGIVPVSLAVAVGVVLLTSGLAVAFTLGPPMAAVVGLYVTLTICYSLVLKAIPVVDIAAVATGFLLRAIGGAVAVGVPVSGPFLLVASFAALFLVVGKRHGERSLLADGAVAHRPTLAAYTPEFTSQLISLSLAGTVISYAAWAFGLDAGEPGVPWVAVSVLPFTVGMMRATQLVLRGEGADPEALLADRGVLLAGVLTAALLIVGLYIW